MRVLRFLAAEICCGLGIAPEAQRYMECRRCGAMGGDASSAGSDAAVCLAGRQTRCARRTRSPESGGNGAARREPRPIGKDARDYLLEVGGWLWAYWLSQQDFMKEGILIKPEQSAAGEARALAVKAKAAADQATDAKLLARLAKRRLKEARRDFKRARKASKKARKEAKVLQAAALAAAGKAAYLRRRKSSTRRSAAARKVAAAASKPAAQKPRRVARKQAQEDRGAAAVRRVGRKAAINIHGSTESRPTRGRIAGTKAAGGGKMKAGVRWHRKRKAKAGKARVVTPLPEQLSRLVARAVVGEQGGSAAPVEGEAGAGGPAPVPAPAAPAAWPDEAEEAGGK